MKTGRFSDNTDGDAEADPNRILKIANLLSATMLPTSDAFSVKEGPQFGGANRGMAVPTLSHVFC